MHGRSMRFGGLLYTTVALRYPLCEGKRFDFICVSRKWIPGAADWGGNARGGRPVVLRNSSGNVNPQNWCNHCSHRLLCWGGLGRLVRDSDTASRPAGAWEAAQMA